MKTFRKTICLLLVLILVLPVSSAFAAPEDTETELYPEHLFSVDSFVSDSVKASYINRMIDYYLETSPELTEALMSGESVMMFFEGGSDLPLTETVRTGAVCLVLRMDEETNIPFIAAHLTDCCTLPDYPRYFDYSNGHTGYGSATLLDGIYSIYTTNHRSIYAGFNVRNGSTAVAPCLYLQSDGSFSILNGMGINVHTRNGQTVSGNQNSPRSAGCLTLSKPTYEDYLALVKAAAPAECTYTASTFSGYEIEMYATGEDGKAGMLVMDRYLAKNELMTIYQNEAAVERITAFSTVRQADAFSGLPGYTFYATHLDAEFSASASVYAFPSARSDSAPISDTSLTVTGLWESDTGEFWYATDAGFLPAESALSVLPVTDDCTIHSENYPVIKQYGKAFSIEGIVAGGYHKIVSVTGNILSADGAVESTATVTNYQASLSLNASDYATSYYNSLDYALGFSRLPVGNHSYQIIANIQCHYVENGELVTEEMAIPVLEKEFRVAHQVSFDTQGGNTVKSQFADADGLLTELPTAEWASHEFLGWFTAPEGGEKVTLDMAFRENTTVYAHWKELFFETQTFNDVTDDSWYAEAVSYVYRNNIMDGTGDGVFSPNTPITRAMFAAILYRLEGRPAVSAACPFTDVVPYSWQEAGIVWAYHVGIMDGYDETRAGPNDPITREQMATLLYRYASHKGYDTQTASLDADRFSDTGKISAYAVTPISWAVSGGLMDGMSDGSLSPRGTATRAQAAAILLRLSRITAK